jgi:HAD superfamily hydrolase (TIGR01549 family)
MIKAIIFDCFGVLYVHRGPEFLRAHAANYQEVKPQLKDLSNQTDYGLISQQEYVESVAELTGLSIEEVDAHSARGFGRNDGLMEYIESTLRPHYKIGLLSNISRGTMEQYFSEKERAQLFDAAALSSETGMIKPNMDAFEHICRLLGVDTSEAIMIDDNADNCRGATLAGMHAIDYDGLAHLQRSLETILPKK